MPVPQQDPVTSHTGNGVTTIFAYDFLLINTVDLQVFVNGDLKTLNVDYTISGVGVPAGGTVTFGAAPAAGAAILLQRAVALQRDTDYQYAGDFQAVTVNLDFNRLWMAIQDGRVLGELGLRFPAGDSASKLLPPVAVRALRALGFDAAGNPVAIAGAGDASELALLLLDDSNAFNGPALVGFDPGLDYPPNTVGSRLAGLADQADPAKGAALLGYKLNALSSVGRLLSAKLAEIISVKDFGAKGDGVTNDTAAIQAADAYARATKSSLYFPDGTYMVSQLVVYTGSNWNGEGRDSTVIKQIVGSNTDLIYGDNSNANWGRTSGSPPTTIVNGYTLAGLTLNGNWNAGAGNTAGSGLAIYGSRPIIRDLFITNCAEYGMRTEYIDSAAGGTDVWTMEGHIDNVRIDTVGKHGWMNNGPHDSVIKDMIVVDAGQAATNTWDGLYLGTGATGKFVSAHVWNRSAAARHRFAVNCDAGSSHEFSGGCHFEGAYSAVVQVLGTNNIFDPSTRIYSAWNGTTLYLGATCTLNRIEGFLEGPGVGRPASIGLVIGSSGTDFISNNTIDLTMSNQNSALVSFQRSTGKNYIRIRGWQTGGVTFTGTPHATDVLDIQNAGHSAALDKAPIRPIAWCTFEVSGGAVTLRSKYNVSSVSRSAAGQFVVNFASAIKNNVAGVTITNDFGGGATGLVGYRPFGNTTTTVDVHFRNSAGGYGDPAIATVMVFQD